MFFGFKNKHTPRVFEYTPRYSNNNSEEAKNTSLDRHGTWYKERLQARSRKNTSLNRLFWLVLFLLIILVLWFFDFDLSFFF